MKAWPEIRYVLRYYTQFGHLKDRINNRKKAVETIDRKFWDNS